jgi:hypothetical protein
MAYKATLRNALLVICTCYAEADLQPTDTPSRLESDSALKVLTEKPRTSRVRCKLCRLVGYDSWGARLLTIYLVNGNVGRIQMVLPQLFGSVCHLVRLLVRTHFLINQGLAPCVGTSSLLC